MNINKLAAIFVRKNKYNLNILKENYNKICYNKKSKKDLGDNIKWKR